MSGGLIPEGVSVFLIMVPTIGLSVLYGWWHGKSYQDHFLLICAQALVAGFVATATVTWLVQFLQGTGIIQS
jgi:hypothetical protein